MNIKKLEPGFYKVQRRDYQGSPRRNRGAHHIIDILHVRGKGDEILYFIGQDFSGRHPDQITDLEYYDVLSKYEGTPRLRECNITISFKDAAGDQFAWTVQGAWALRQLFEDFPWLKVPFNFVPKKSKIIKR